MSGRLNFNGVGKFIIRSKNSLRFYLLPLAVCLLTVFCTNAGAQTDEPPPNAAPPPVKSVSKDEKIALDGVSDLKSRTKLALDLMDARLKKAEELNTQENFNGMYVELGGFHALMDDTIKYLDRNDNGSGKTLNTFKRFEMALRGFMPRIELIRRELPDKFEFYVRKLAKTVRDVRSRAVEPLFSNTVVPNGGN